MLEQFIKSKVNFFDFKNKSSFSDAVSTKPESISISLECSSLNFNTCLSKRDAADDSPCLNLSSLTNDSLDSKSLSYQAKTTQLL